MRLQLVANNNLLVYTAEPDPYTNNNGVRDAEPEPDQRRHRSSATPTTTSATCSAPAAAAWPTWACRARPAARPAASPGVRQPDRRRVRRRLRGARDGPPVRRQPHVQRHRPATAAAATAPVNRLRAGQRLHDHGLRRHLRRARPAAAQRPLLPLRRASTRSSTYTPARRGQRLRPSTATGNSRRFRTVPAGGFTIPAQTPFALTGSGTDANGDSLTYNWEEFDLGPAGAGRRRQRLRRSSAPGTRRTSPTRTFPRLTDLLASTVAHRRESCPTSTRTLQLPGDRARQPRGRRRRGLRDATRST